MKRIDILRADRADWFNRRVKYVLWILVLVWIVSTFGLRQSSHRTLEHVADNLLLSRSRDAGLQMTLKEAFPQHLLSIHSFAGAMLLVGCLLQKQLVVWMVDNYSTWALVHRINGAICIISMLCMAGGGFFMGPYSTWERFEIFSFFFALPWLIWVVLIYMSVQLEQYQWHRLFGNQCLKGCITVPLARLCGAWVQANFPQWGEANGYYIGIGFVVLLVGIWEMLDVYSFVVVQCVPHHRHNKKD